MCNTYSQATQVANNIFTATQQKKTEDKTKQAVQDVQQNKM